MKNHRKNYNTKASSIENKIVICYNYNKNVRGIEQDELLRGWNRGY